VENPKNTLVSAIAAEIVRLISPKLADLMPTVIQPALLNVKEAAIYLGRTEQAVQHMVRDYMTYFVHYKRLETHSCIPQGSGRGWFRGLVVTSMRV
jgi:hypothetical protein